MTSNVVGLTGSPVLVQIDATTTGPDSVHVVSTVLFLDGSTLSAKAYQDTLEMGVANSIYGDSFGDMEVDAGSLSFMLANNPSKLPLIDVYGIQDLAFHIVSSGMPL